MVSSSVDIYCTIDPTTLEGRNSSHLIFKKGQEEVPQQQISILNSTSIRLHIDKTTENDSGWYQCYVTMSPGQIQGIGMSVVSIGYKPERITDFKCRTDNWENITCSFTKPMNAVPTEYKIEYCAKKNQNYWIACIESYKNSTVECKPTTYLKYDTILVFRINITNDLGNLSQSVTVDNYATIVPAQPNSIEHFNITSRSIVIQWEIPYKLVTLYKYGHIKLVHDLQLYSEYDSSWAKVDKSVKELDPNAPDKKSLKYFVELDDLQYANAWYDVRIRIRVNKAYDPDNMWSEAAALNFRTKSRKPDRPPTIDQGAFYINDYNEITIFWKELGKSERNGNNSHYNVSRVTRDGQDIHVKLTDISNTMARFPRLDMDANYEITVKSYNDDGASDNGSVIRIPRTRNRLSHPKNLKKSSLDGVYNLTWEINSALLQNGRLSYTVFWCEPKNSQYNACGEGFNFAHVDQETFTFSLEAKTTPNFAIAVNSENSSSGMSWTMCTAASPNEIGQIKTIWVKHIEATQMEIEWKLECEDSLIVQGYNLSYCPITAIIDPKIQECKEPEKSVNISGSATKYNITDLKPYMTYKIVASMYSETREGPKSKPMENTTLEAAPSPPRDFKAYDVRNTSMMLQWRVPKDINGVLMYYEIHFNGDHKKLYDVKNDTTKEPYEVMEYHLQNLVSFTEYEVLVRACTKYCSENSNIDRRKTAIGVPGTMLQPNTRANESVVEVSWQEPGFKGGRIDYYELKTVSRSKGHVKDERIVQICGTRTRCRRAPLCTDGSEVYEFYVRPVNVIFSPHAKATNITCASYPDKALHANQYVDMKSGVRAQPLVDNSNFIQKVDTHDKHPTRHHHQSCENDNNVDLRSFLQRDPYAHHLPGEWSKPLVTNCYHTGEIAPKTIVTIICSIGLMFTMLVMSYKFYKKIKDMKNIVIVLPPGLEDITKEVKPSDLEKKPKPDVITNGNVGSLFRGGEEDHLLRRRAESNSSGRSQSDRSQSQSDGLGDSVDENTYDAQQLMEDDSHSNHSGPVDQHFKVSNLSKLILLSRKCTFHTSSSGACQPPRVSFSSKNAEYLLKDFTFLGIHQLIWK